MKKDDKKPSDVSPSISMVSFSVANEPEIKKINHDESDQMIQLQILNSTKENNNQDKVEEDEKQVLTKENDIDNPHPNVIMSHHNTQSISNSSYGSSVSDSIPSSDRVQQKKAPAKKTITNKVIIDPIESIYSKQISVSVTLRFQYILILMIMLFVFSFNWVMLFVSADKRERNYCFSLSRNQFDACSSAQMCKKYEEKINIFLYDLNKTFLNDFASEISYVNKNYKKFFIQQTRNLFKKKTFNKHQIDFENETLNCVYVFSAKEKWIFFVRYFSLCQETNAYMILVILFSIGGIIGFVVFGFLSDIYGRRIIIIIALGILSVLSLMLVTFTFIMEYKEEQYKKEFFRSYSPIEYGDILANIYYQSKLSELWNKLIFIFFVFVFFVGFSINPLFNVCLSLLIENSLNDSSVLFQFGHFFAMTYGVTPFFTYLIFPLINDVRVTFLIYSIGFISLFILSILTLEDSMRQLFEYCEWQKLTKIVLKCLPDLKEKDFCNDVDYNMQLQEESEYARKVRRNELVVKKRESLFMVVKKRINELNKLIRRNSEFVIKREEVINYPFIIFTCLLSNRIIQNTKLILIQTTLLVFIISNLLTRDCLSLSFFTEEDLRVKKGGNIIVNSPYFILLLGSLFSIYFYCILYRVANFKKVIIGSLVVISICSIIDHLLTAEISNEPIDLNRYNSGMTEMYQDETFGTKIIGLLIFMKMVMNGVLLFLALLLCKYSRTLYRGTLLGIGGIFQSFSFLISETIKWQMRHTMLFSGVITVLAIITILFINEAVDESYIVNDVKKKVNKESK